MKDNHELIMEFPVNRVVAILFVISALVLAVIGSTHAALFVGLSTTFALLHLAAREES